MIASLRFLDQLQVVVERLLRLPRGAVDALQAGVVLVTAPVRSRAAGQLERGNEFRGRNVRAAAEVTPNTFAGTGIEIVVGGQLVAADLHHLGIARLVVDELQFVRLVGKFFARLVFRLVDAAGEQLALLDDLAHALFQRFQILRGERVGDVEVVVEAVGDRRANAELGIREHLLNRLGQYVGRGVPNDAAPVVGVGGHRGHLDIGIGRPAQVAQPAVGITDDDDRIVGAAARQPRVAHRCRRGRPGSDPDRGCWRRAGGGAHRSLSTVVALLACAGFSWVFTNATMLSGRAVSPRPR